MYEAIQSQPSFNREQLLLYDEALQHVGDMVLLAANGKGMRHKGGFRPTPAKLMGVIDKNTVLVQPANHRHPEYAELESVKLWVKGTHNVREHIEKHMAKNQTRTTGTMRPPTVNDRKGMTWVVRIGDRLFWSRSRKVTDSPGDAMTYDTEDGANKAAGHVRNGRHMGQTKGQPVSVVSLNTALKEFTRHELRVVVPRVVTEPEKVAEQPVKTPPAEEPTSKLTVVRPEPETTSEPMPQATKTPASDAVGEMEQMARDFTKSKAPVSLRQSFDNWAYARKESADAEILMLEAKKSEATAMAELDIAAKRRELFGDELT